VLLDEFPFNRHSNINTSKSHSDYGDMESSKRLKEAGMRRSFEKLQLLKERRCKQTDTDRKKKIGS